MDSLSIIQFEINTRRANYVLNILKSYLERLGFKTSHPGNIRGFTFYLNFKSKDFYYSDDAHIWVAFESPKSPVYIANSELSFEKRVEPIIVGDFIQNIDVIVSHLRELEQKILDKQEEEASTDNSYGGIDVNSLTDEEFEEFIYHYNMGTLQYLEELADKEAAADEEIEGNTETTTGVVAKAHAKADTKARSCAKAEKKAGAKDKAKYEAYAKMKAKSRARANARKASRSEKYI